MLRQIDDALVAAYLVDEGGAFQHVSAADLRSSGLSPEELHALAIANLADYATGRTRIHQQGNIHAVILDGNFEASLPLVEEFRTEWVNEMVPQGFAVALPGVLAFGDIESPAAIAN